MLTATQQRHYAHFSGLEPLPAEFGVVIGNCQAESLRIVLDAPERSTVRVPPVHELDPGEAGRLHEVVARAAFVAVHPIRDDYHSLPLGTRQLAASAAPGVPVVTFPSVRFAGLHPFQAALRVAGVGEEPPLVAYHDVRILAEASGLAVAPALSAADVRAVADDSLAELRRRERVLDVAASDLLIPVETDLMRTVNHPGNALWMPLAQRLLERLGLPGAPTDPGRPILNAVRAPLEPWVLEAWELEDPPRDHWIVDGETLEVDRVRDAHLEWYARNPEFVVAAQARLGELLQRWSVR